MRLVPERISAAWIGTLTDDDLVDVEARLHARFVDLERREKKSRGAKYDLLRRHEPRRKVRRDAVRTDRPHGGACRRECHRGG